MNSYWIELQENIQTDQTHNLQKKKKDKKMK